MTSDRHQDDTGGGDPSTASTTEGEEMTIMAHQTPAYGQWRVVVTMADGREAEGWGLTELEATRRAQFRATQEACAGCGRGVLQGEAEVSRIACSLVLCASCREGRRPAG